jgi:hypothetical protein
MKEKTKNNGFSLESLLDTDAALRRAAISAINNMGKIIALFVSLLTVAVTFTDVSFGAVLSESFASSLLLLLCSSYIIYFSLEDAGERCGEDSDEYTAAKKRYSEACQTLGADKNEAFRIYLTEYCRREYEARRSDAIFSLGISEEDIDKYKRGDTLDRRTARRVRSVERIKPIVLNPRAVVSYGKLSRRSELESPEGRKLISLILRLIPSTVCMTVTVSVALSAKDGLTPADVLEGILKLSALPMIGFKGYSAGYVYSKHTAAAWLETKARIIEGFIAECG